MSDFSKTKAKTRELVPRLMELSFGCMAIQEHTAEVFYYGGHGLWFSFRNPNVRINFNDFNGEIIGHPITLEDVIEVIEISCIKEKYIIHKNKEVLSLLRKWERGKDFDHQEEETKDFITDILFS